MISFSLYKYFVQFICIAGILSMFSCSTDDENRNIPSPSTKKAQIMLQLPDEDETTRASEAGLPDENRIKNLYLFVFDNLGTKEFEKYIEIPYTASNPDIDMSLWGSEKVIILLDNTILSSLDKSRNIHIVANIPQSKLASINNEAALKAVISNAITSEITSPGETTPLVMHGVCPAHVFTSNVRATVPLVRNVAKIRLKVNTTNSSLGANTVQFAPGNNIFVTTASVADRSYIVSGSGQNPAGTSYINYTARTLTGTSTGPGTTTFDLPAVYINENIGDKTAPSNPVILTPTYLVIKVPFNAGEGIVNDNYYKIQINNENGFFINRNTIYDITVDIKTLGGETEQTAPVVSATLEVLPWNEKTLVSDMTQTYISVEKTTVDIAAGDFNFQCSTNADDAKKSVSSNQSWLTATFSGNNNIKIIASGTGYTAPRSATLTIKANDLQKTITVTQKALPVSDGSITLNPKKIYLSKVTQTRPVTLTVTNNAQWKNLLAPSGIATYTPASGSGNATINFTRGGTFANGIFQFINLNTLNYDVVELCNLNLTSSVSELNVPGKGVTNAKEIGITALGGDAIWKVKSKPTWVTSAVNSGGDLLYTVAAEPSEKDRSGDLILCHVNDENLTVTIKIKQSAQYVMFDEFDYIVLKVKHSSTGTLDTQVEISGTGITGVDNKPVGYDMGQFGQINEKPAGQSYNVATQYYNNTTKDRLIVQWAGDSHSSSYKYMTSMVNLWNICYTDINDKFPADRRYFNIDIYATWWSSNRPSNYATVPVELDMVLYKGGTMSSVNYEYVNTGGTKVPGGEATYTGFRVATSASTYPSFRTTSTKLGTVVYDRYKNTATFTLPGPTGRSVNNYVEEGEPLLPGETREEYSKRMDEYHKNK